MSPRNHPGATPPCHVCGQDANEGESEHRAGICRGPPTKTGIALLIMMIIASSIVLFGLLT